MGLTADGYFLEKRKNLFLLSQIEPHILDLSTRPLATTLNELYRLHQVSRVPLNHPPSYDISAFCVEERSYWFSLKSLHSLWVRVLEVWV
jgi:hypothetical protein